VTVTDTITLTDRIDAGLERERDTLLALSHRIHANPETAYEERLACCWCADLLRTHGFTLATPVAGLETAFRARWGTGRPAVAFLAEYDALPELGHACGHNIIAASALGAGIVLSQVLAETGAAAAVIVDGTPAEETTGGKIPMVKSGLYDDVDVVLSMHPETCCRVGWTCLGRSRLSFTFRGRAAHAAAEPEAGLNALDGVLHTFAAVNALRQHVRPDTRLHGVITHGGRTLNIVPDFARAEFAVRSGDPRYLEEVLEKVRSCARAAALATGTHLDIQESPVYEPLRRNPALSALILEVIAELGIQAEDGSSWCFPASTDLGNVSQVAPSSAPMFRVAPEGTVLHHPDFARAAVSEEGDAAVLAATKVLALAGLRLILEPEKLAAVRAVHRHARALDL